MVAPYNRAATRAAPTTTWNISPIITPAIVGYLVKPRTPKTVYLIVSRMIWDHLSLSLWRDNQYQHNVGATLVVALYIRAATRAAPTTTWNISPIVTPAIVGYLVKPRTPKTVYLIVSRMIWDHLSLSLWKDNQYQHNVGATLVVAPYIRGLLKFEEFFVGFVKMHEIEKASRSNTSNRHGVLKGTVAN